jgi:methylmalonyl-CoA/ethylmalonyl-CoA epimerase
MIGRLNHVGVATPSIENSLRTYEALFGPLELIRVGPMPEQGVSVVFVQLPNAQIELLEPYGENSPLDRFLERFPGGGQHHLCFEVPDILAAGDDLTAKGARVLGPPRIGAHGAPVIFIHPGDASGVLLELMQVPA